MSKNQIYYEHTCHICKNTFRIEAEKKIIDHFKNNLYVENEPCLSCKEKEYFNAVEKEIKMFREKLSHARFAEREDERIKEEYRIEIKQLKSQKKRLEEEIKFLRIDDRLDWKWLYNAERTSRFDCEKRIEKLQEASVFWEKENIKNNKIIISQNEKIQLMKNCPNCEGKDYIGWCFNCKRNSVKVFRGEIDHWQLKEKKKDVLQS